MPPIRYIRYLSDLHLEHDARYAMPANGLVWTPPALPEDGETALVLAGDIWNGIRPLIFNGVSWLAAAAARFAAVVVVLGNHDYWKAQIGGLPDKWRVQLVEQGLQNVHLLELSQGVSAGWVDLGDLVFVGGTAWTDIPSPLARVDFDNTRGGDGRFLWNDRNYIRTRQYHRFSSADWIAEHHLFKQNLAQALALPELQSRDVVLVTHHAPCTLSAPPRKPGDTSHLFYASDLTPVVLEHPNVRLAIHGHTHTSLDYYAGDLRVVCNPRGYRADPNPEFNPLARVAL